MAPLISWVSAGGLAHASTSMLRDVPLIPMAGLDAGEYFATQVRGDSMDRISPEGSVIIVDRADRRLLQGKPYVFAYRGETTYKLWFADPDQLAPFSLNPLHRPIFPRRESDWEVVGRVRRSILDFS
jgi:SOS-response transcriptional repressor LexA